MIIVAEKINTSRKGVADAVERRDAEFIIKLARDQAEAGADYIDVNAGTFLDRETECLCWLVETVQDAVNLPLCLDSPNPKALSEAMKRHRGEPMINSISLDTGRFTSLLPVVTSRDCHVVALCMASTGMPRTAEERVLAGSELVGKLVSEGIPLERILVDPLVQPISVDRPSIGNPAVVEPSDSHAMIGAPAEATTSSFCPSPSTSPIKGLQYRGSPMIVLGNPASESSRPW